MWKTWKREIIGISAAVVAVICIIVVFTLRMNEGVYKTGSYKPHLMVEDTVYWLSAASYPASILPEGYAEFARVETKIAPNARAEQNGEGNGVAAGTAVYGNPSRPGWVYVPTANGRWNRFTVIDLQSTFLRYNGKLYLAKQSIPYELENVSVTFNPKHFSSTGETVSWPGDREVLPTEDCTTNSSAYTGGEICLNPKQPELALVKRTYVRDGKTETDYHAFVTAESLGLDYSAYE